MFMLSVLKIIPIILSTFLKRVYTIIMIIFFLIKIKKIKQINILNDNAYPFFGKLDDINTNE